MPDVIPGREAMIKLVQDVSDPKVIYDLKPIDVSYIDDPGMRAVVALATALEWNVAHKSGKPVTLIARDGFKHVLPTDTSVRFQVFVNRVNATITHSLTAIPSIELMEKIIKQYKLDPSHARVFRAAAGDGVVDGVVDPNEPDEHLPEERDETQAATDRRELLHVEEATEPEVVFEPTERVEPTLNHMGDGDQYISPIMDTVYRQLIPDGADQVTYRCKVCALEFETKRGVGAHYQRHVQAGEAEPTANQPRTVVNNIPDYVPTEVHMPRKDMAQELRRLRRIVQDVQKAVGQEAIKAADRRIMIAERKQQAAEAERDEALARADRLGRDLRTLRELIGGISDE